jgi:hypothetical protein
MVREEKKKTPHRGKKFRKYFRICTYPGALPGSRDPG